LLAAIVISTIISAVTPPPPLPASHIAVGADSVLTVAGDVFGLGLATWLMLFTERGLVWRDLGLGRDAASPSRIGFGALVGALGIGVPSALLLVFRDIGVQSAQAGSWTNAAVFDAAFFAFAAAFEEIIIRGYIFSLIRRKWGWKAALVSTSIAFGAFHLMNPGVSVESIINVTLAGFLLGGILIVTRSLYAAIAAHLAWNWTMSAIFHSAVSGATIPAPNYVTVDNGPDWLTGGQWGPEGGAAAAVAMLIIIFYLYRLRKTRAES
jgi:membrane protease YdiL (CAAX protease family)